MLATTSPEHQAYQIVVSMLSMCLNMAPWVEELAEALEVALEVVLEVESVEVSVAALAVHPTTSDRHKARGMLATASEVGTSSDY